MGGALRERSWSADRCGGGTGFAPASRFTAASYLGEDPRHLRQAAILGRAGMGLAVNRFQTTGAHRAGAKEGTRPMKSKPVLTQSDVARVLEAARAEATAHGWAVTLAVADDGGHLLALERLDGCAPVGAYVAAEKARTSALGRREQGLRGHDQQRPHRVPVGAARRHAGGRRAHRRWRGGWWGPSACPVSSPSRMPKWRRRAPRCSPERSGRALPESFVSTNEESAWRRCAVWRSCCCSRPPVRVWRTACRCPFQGR